MPEKPTAAPPFRKQDGTPLHPTEALEEFERKLAPLASMTESASDLTEVLTGGLVELHADFRRMRDAVEEWCETADGLPA